MRIRGLGRAGGPLFLVLARLSLSAPAAAATPASPPVVEYSIAVDLDPAALPSPVPPHGRITLEIAFRAKLPRIFARTGFVRDYFLVGQWFPKIGVYEATGVRQRAAGGWNCHAFHANSEFYADYGSWDV